MALPHAQNKTATETLETRRQRLREANLAVSARVRSFRDAVGKGTDVERRATDALMQAIEEARLAREDVPFELRFFWPNPEDPEDQERRECQREKNQPAIDLLRSWSEATGADAEEQRQTGEELMRAIEEGRTRIQMFRE